MSRRITSLTTLDNLKKEAKRRRRANPDVPLRVHQHELAREYGFPTWAALKAALASPALPSDRFLEFACPDHHVRGATAHRMAEAAAIRLLARFPELARADIDTAVVCGELDHVARLLRELPGVANARRAPQDTVRSGSGDAFDFLTKELAPKDWTPLHFLCFARLPLPRVNDNAVAIARLLLDRGADPNAFFLAGGSRYTPLVGVMGEGEEDRPPHPRRDELARLLIERGADPNDEQVQYNVRVHSPRPVTDDDPFVAAVLRLDRPAVEAAIAADPELLGSPKALFAAAREDRPDAIALLLDLGVPINARDDHDQCALHVAAWHNARRAAEFLIARGIDVDVTEQRYSGTPLGFAVHADHRDMIEVIAPHSRDVWNLVPLGKLDRLREVLAADPRLATVSAQTTPLFWLPDDEGVALEIVKLFLANGADPAFRNPKDGTTAAAFARTRGLDKIAALLESVSAGAAWPQLAEDFVQAYEGDAAAIARLNAHYQRSFTRDDIRAEAWRRVYALRQRSSKVAKNVLQLEEAQLLLAQDAGLQNWDALVTKSQPALPPFAIDERQSRVYPRRRLTDREWDDLVAVAKERGVSALDAEGLMNDRAIARVATLDTITSLDLGGSRELTDDGLLQLARMPQLERLNLSEYPGGKLTDRGLAVLRHLPKLRHFEMTWQAGITDAGVANLRFCDLLETVNLMGSPTGDGAVEALRGKAHLRKLQTGRLLTDGGLAFLPDVTELLLDGPITDESLAHVARRSSLRNLDLFWHVDRVTAAGFAHLTDLPNLEVLGCDGQLSNDEAMVHIGAMPSLKRLRAQESAATDEGFVALARSRTLEGYWGRNSQGFGDRAFAAFSKIPTLRSLGVSLAGVSDLSRLPAFPQLRELTPIGLKDDGFRHVGQCHQLERLTCMYCRDSGDAATEFIANLKLKYYYAGLTRITDRSLEILGTMDSLEKIELYECPHVTDAGLPHLANLPNLREVHLNGLPGVTLEGTKIFPGSVAVHYST